MDWVFQANPSLYNVVAALDSNRRDEWWAMNQNRALVTPGDRVFIWQSGGDASLLAVARVTSPVYDREDSKYWKRAVDIEYEWRVRPPLTRAEIREDPVLSRIRVFKGFQGTNFVLSADEVAVLEAKLQGRLTPMNAPATTDANVIPMRQLSEALKGVQRENTERLLAYMSTMDPFLFEWLVAAVLVRSGYSDVEVTSRTGDKGIDVKATIRAGGFAPLRVFVQAKRNASVGRPVVQRLRGSCPSGYAAMLVTSGDFTDDARAEAGDPTKHNAVTLVNGRQFAQLMLEHGIGAERRTITTHTLDLDTITPEFLEGIVGAVSGSEDAPEAQANTVQ